LLVAVAAVFVAAPPAVAAGRSCGTVRVSARSTLRIMFGTPGALAQRRDTAYVVSTTANSCAGAWRLLQTVVPAGDERAAIRARGFRVVGLDQFRLPGGERFHRVIVGRGGERVSYVRAGGDWVDGVGLGGGLGGVAPIRCARRYQVLGLRGSGQKLEGPFGMASTVGAVAEAMVSELGVGSVRAVSIPYPAASTGLLARGDIGAFLGSLYRGQELLSAEIHRITRQCPRARIAVVGFSQGAAAASEVLRSLPRHERDHVNVAVLIADPYSNRGGGDDLVIDPLRPGAQAVRAGEGVLGGRPPGLPSNRVWDVCQINDLICDSRPGFSGKILQYLLTPVHSSYPSCCFGVPLLRVVGRDAARRLRG
jgi:Cutinase